jgi:hypothetical protein
VYLWHIFLVKPLAALSILLCLATILFCVLLERKRPHQRADRFMIGFLGLLAVYQGLRVLQGAGIVTLNSSGRVDDAIEFVVTGFYLVAAVVLRLATMDHLNTESAMRLVRAAPPRSQLRNPDVERDLARLAWALPRLSDGAFRLYAYLCLRHDQTGAHAPISSADVRLQLGKSKEDLDRDMGELESAGAVQVARDGANVGITIVAQPATPGFYLPVETGARNVAAMPEGVV